MIIGISGKAQSGKNTVASIIQYLTSDDCSKQCLLRLRAGLNIEGYHNSQWKQKAFAHKLKQIVSILTGIPVEDLEKQEVKDRLLGEEWNRYLLEECWINDEYAEHEQFTYFASNEDMQKYISDMGHTDSTCSQVGKISITVQQLLQEIGTDAMRNIIHPNCWLNALFADYIPSGAPYNNLGDLYDDLKYIPSETKLPNWIITDIRFENELQSIKDRGGITIRVNRPNLIENNHLSETSLDNAEFDFVIHNDRDMEHLINEVKKILIKKQII